MELITLLLGLAVGVGGTYIICRFLPQQKVRQLNVQVIKEEEEKLLVINKTRKDLVEQCQDLQNEYTKLIERRDIIQENLFEMEKQAKHSADEFLKSKMELAQEQFDRQLEIIAKQYQQDEEEYKQHYLGLLEEFSNKLIETQKEYQILENELQEKYNIEQNKFNNLKAIVDCAVDVARREEEKKQENNYYRLILSQTDIEEIKKLRSVEPYLRDKEALNKVIWKVYYEKPYTDLVGRVIGNQVKTGIYKITNIENQMCYVGQSVDLASRWKQHIKRGIGAEAPTRNKLYPAMLSFGVENFTFEIVEECDKFQLDEKEKFWQNYFQANTFGYSIK